MAQPTILALIKPEEGVRSPEVIDDSKLIGILDTIGRFQTGEIDSVNLSDTLDTLSSIIRQILCGEDPTGSYLKYPAKNIKEIASDITTIENQLSALGIIPLTATENIAQFEFIKLTGNDAMGLALANSSVNSKALGCLIDTAKTTGQTGNVSISGTKVSGILSGASFGTRYYLSTSTPGAITTAITTSGVQLEVGVALNATDLLLDIKVPFIKNLS